MLEVNAPIVDYPLSAKARLDRALLIEPFRRWREYLCRHVDLFVTTSATILPAFVDRARVLEILEERFDTMRAARKFARLHDSRVELCRGF